MKTDQGRIEAALRGADRATVVEELRRAGWRPWESGPSLGGPAFESPSTGAAGARVALVAWSGDDPASRPGLAVLREVARGLPARGRARSALILVLREPDEPAIGPAPPDASTLVLAVDAPGAGELLVIRGRRGPAVDLVERAALDLRLPHRRRSALWDWPFGQRRPGHEPFARLGWPAASLTGSDPRAAVDPARVAAAAYLAVEVALRWSRGQP